MTFSLSTIKAHVESYANAAGLWATDAHRAIEAFVLHLEATAAAAEEKLEAELSAAANLLHFHGYAFVAPAPAVADTAPTVADTAPAVVIPQAGGTSLPEATADAKPVA